jgi:hypothetical protein
MAKIIASPRTRGEVGEMARALTQINPIMLQSYVEAF